MAYRLLALLLTSPLLLVTLGAGHASNHQAPLPKVAVSQPIPREVTDHTDFRGRVEPGESAEVCSRAGGALAEVTFKPGDAVKKGDLLFRLDPRSHKAALDKAEADAVRAQAGVRRAAADLARAKRLVGTGVGSKEEAEVAAAALAEAEAALKAARAGLEMAQLSLEHTRVVAPLSGRVGRPLVSSGGVVNAASPLVTVSSMDPVHVTFDIDEGTALRLVRGPKGKKPAEPDVQVGLADEEGLPHRGRLDLSDLRIHPATGTAQVRVALPNPDGLFLPGLSARIRLVEGKPYKALMVTYRALLSDAQGYYVLVVSPAGVVERRQVKPGRQQGGLVPVKDGLRAADLVVIEAGMLTGRARGGEAAPEVGTAVDPEKVAMPERAPRSESLWDRDFSSSQKGREKMGGGKGKARP
ncbi:MAG: efflux RND transporter periplasmic adaptor subunit [Gemmataceae bacterium]